MAEKNYTNSEKDTLLELIFRGHEIAPETSTEKPSISFLQLEKQLGEESRSDSKAVLETKTANLNRKTAQICRD